MDVNAILNECYKTHLNYLQETEEVRKILEKYISELPEGLRDIFRESLGYTNLRYNMHFTNKQLATALADLIYGELLSVIR